MLSYFHRFGIFVWMGENNNLNMLHVDVYFFKNEEKIFILKNIWMCVDRALTTAFLRGRQRSSFELKITQLNDTFIKGWSQHRVNYSQIPASKGLFLIGICEYIYLSWRISL